MKVEKGARPFMLTGTPKRERSREESVMESTPGPQFATEGMWRASSNMMSVRQFVDDWASRVFFA